MTIRETLAEYCAGLEYRSLPVDIVRQARNCLLDHACLMIASSKNRSEDNVDIARFTQEMAGKQESTLIGTSTRVPCLNAALANTHVASDTGLDSIHKTTIIHLSAALVPATLAVAEMRRSRGKDLVLAIVAGAEIMARVGLALGTRGSYARGFHPTSVCAPFGCGVAAGKLLGLNKSQFAETLSTAAVLASGSPLFGGEVHPTSWYLQIGRGAQSGVLAAMMAKEGMTGPQMIFEDEQGFLTGYSASPTPAELTRNLGKKYELSDLILKKYGVGIYVVTAIEALERLTRENQIAAADIDSMTLELPATVMPRVGFPEYPANRGATRVSARYILAVSMYLGARMAFSTTFSDAGMRDAADIKDLFNRTTVIGNIDLDRVFPEKKACILTVQTRDGRRLSLRHDGPFKGDPENPLSESEIEMKFDRLAAPVIGERRATDVKDIVRRLETLEDVSELIRLLSP